MANGLISAAQYGGAQEDVVEAPQAPAPAPEATLPFQDEPEPQIRIPTAADVAPDPTRNIAEEQNWMKELNDYANTQYQNENEREKFIERASRYTRNNIAFQKAANQQILLSDKASIDKVLFDQNKFQGRGPRNDYEASLVNPGWAAMRQITLDHKPAMQEYIDNVFAHNSKMDVPPTTERDARFKQIYNMIISAQAGDPQLDKNKILDQVNPAGYDLTHDQVRQLRHELGVLKSQKDINNQLGHYMSVVGNMVNLAGIPATSPLIEQLKGAILYEVKDRQRKQEDPGAPIDDEQVRSITADLLRYNPNQWPTGMQWMHDPGRRFEVPEDWLTDENRDQLRQELHREPLPEDIYAKYKQWKIKQAK